jgi:GxxExxY protein
MLRKLEEERLDLVTGVRLHRNDNFIRRLSSSIANAVRGALLQDHTSDTGCTLKVIRAEAAKRLPGWNGMHRFIPALVLSAGYKIGEMPVEHRARHAGVSKVAGRLARDALVFAASVQRPLAGGEAMILAAKEHKGPEQKTDTIRSIFELCGMVRETAYAIHVYHGHGHLEKVYENALAHRLRKIGLDVKQQHPIKVLDEDGVVLGDFLADLLVENLLVVELKAAKTLADEHVAQILGYLKSTRLEHGLLINFGSYKFQIKKYVRSEHPPIVEDFLAAKEHIDHKEKIEQ